MRGIYLVLIATGMAGVGICGGLLIAFSDPHPSSTDDAGGAPSLDIAPTLMPTIPLEVVPDPTPPSVPSPVVPRPVTVPAATPLAPATSPGTYARPAIDVVPAVAPRRMTYAVTPVREQPAERPVEHRAPRGDTQGEAGEEPNRTPAHGGLGRLDPHRHGGAVDHQPDRSPMSRAHRTDPAPPLLARPRHEEPPRRAHRARTWLRKALARPSRSTRRPVSPRGRAGDEPGRARPYAAPHESSARPRRTR